MRAPSCFSCLLDDYCCDYCCDVYVQLDSLLATGDGLQSSILLIYSVPILQVALVERVLSEYRTLWLGWRRRVRARTVAYHCTAGARHWSGSSKCRQLIRFHKVSLISWRRTTAVPMLLQLTAILPCLLGDAAGCAWRHGAHVINQYVAATQTRQI